MNYLILILGLLFYETALCKVRPLLEWGLFLGHGKLADYPASNEYRYRTIPFPYASYQGEIFRTDEQDGTRFRILNNPNFDFDLSFGGSFPTETENNQARLGMPNLDWTFELGPRLLYYFYRDNNVASIRLGLPLRASFSTDFTATKSVGYLFCPTFQIDKYKFISENLDIYLAINLNYFDQGEASFFYQVSSDYQTPMRKTFSAKPGFIGWDIALGTKYQLENKILLVGAQYSDHSQSANHDSPLHRSDYNHSFFIGLGWLLYQSDPSDQYQRMGSEF